MNYNIIKKLDSDRGVSPVIGVILMVAITVILAAVIGAFVLGLGDDLGNSSGPQAQLSFDGDATNGVTISHNGGDTIEGAELRGDAVSESVTVSGTENKVDGFSLSAGNSVTVDGLGNGALNIIVGDSMVGSYEVPAGTSEEGTEQESFTLSIDSVSSEAITLTPTSDGDAITENSDSTGEVDFTNIPHGEYTVSAENTAGSATIDVIDGYTEDNITLN